MGVSIEPQIWIARFGAAHHAYGDPYSGSCVIRRTMSGVEVLSATGEHITHAERRQLQELLHRAGITGGYIWGRHRDDGTIHYARGTL